MLGVLLFKEIREHLLTFRFGAALVATLILVIVSFWVLGDDYLRRRDAYNRLTDEYAGDLKDVHVFAMYFPRVHREPSPLSIFAQGETKNLGNTVEIRRWSVPERAGGSLTDNMLLAAYPSFDLLTILTLVVSGFGILLSYDAFSGEKENGTLKHVCSCSAPRGIIFSAKFLGGVAVLVLPLLFSVISGLVLVSLVHGITFSAVQWLAIVVILAAGMTYGALFIALGMLCSAVVGKSSHSLVLTLLIWTLGVLIIPQVANDLCSAVQPLPSATGIDLYAEESLRQARAREAELIAELPGGDIEMWGAAEGEGCYLFDGNPGAFAAMAGRLRVQEGLRQRRAEELWQLTEKQYDAMRGQAKMRQLLALPSPAAQLRSALTCLAGTDYETYDKFMEYARRYRRELLRFFRQCGFFDENVHEFITRRKADEITEDRWRQRVAEYSNLIRSGRRGEVINWSRFGELPLDSLPRLGVPGAEPNIENALYPIGSLAFMTALFLACGFFAFSRYDVR